jgi:hypothetical protein
MLVYATMPSAAAVLVPALSLSASILTRSRRLNLELLRTMLLDGSIGQAMVGAAPCEMSSGVNGFIVESPVLISKSPSLGRIEAGSS